MSDNFDFLESARHYYDQSSESTFSNILYMTLIFEYENLMKKGLLKSYVIHAENTSSMRGKLLMQHQMLNDAMKKPQFFCEFDELEYDSIENRVILEALTVIERTSDNPRIRMKSMDLAQRLSGVVKKTSVPRLTRKRMMQSYNRQNLRYQRIHQVCDQIIDKSGIDDIYRGDNSYVIPVFYDMNVLFESFIQKLFQWFYQDLDLKVETQFSKKAWTGQGDLGNRSMRPDITIWDGKICTHIIDVKYKTKNISTGDLYQLGFYMHEFSEQYNPREKQIKNAIALTPEFTDAKSGMYESITGKQVFVKRIDVEACLDIMNTSNWDSLKPIIESWIEPNENLN
jgi:5-methylcytosine-specific restriction endonuclease McrBC regulatory subunit McrC